MHRGRRYIIKSMESPPSFLGGCSFGPYGCGNLMAFATPTTLQYTTQALSTNEITIVKQIKHAELTQRQETEKVGNEDQSTVAGYGVVTVKRTVRGYKKLSLINRTDLSRFPCLPWNSTPEHFGLTSTLFTLRTSCGSSMAGCMPYRMLWLRWLLCSYHVPHPTLTVIIADTIELRFLYMTKGLEGLG